MLLKVSDVRAGYRDKEILFGVSLAVDQGEIVALLGHNGAGKTTLFRAIYGLCTVYDGTIEYMNKNIRKSNIRDLTGNGLIYIPDGHQIFGELKVAENLKLIRSLANPDAYDARIRDIYDMFPRLAERKNQVAETLSGGEQQMLTMAMGLLMNPKLLMLDEPLVGLAPSVVKSILEAIETIRKEFNVGILFIEQNVSQALTVASRVYIMKLGKLLLESSADEFGKRKNMIDYF